MLNKIRTGKHAVAWDTAIEMDYLRTMLERNKNNAEFDVKAALRGYIEAAYKRFDWGLMSRDACIEYAREQLAGV